MARKYASNVNETQIFSILDTLFGKYAKQRKPEETFGDFLLRAKLLDENSNN